MGEISIDDLRGKTFTTKVIDEKGNYLTAEVRIATLEEVNKNGTIWDIKIYDAKE